jgi:carboxypeptidase T
MKTPSLRAVHNLLRSTALFVLLLCSLGFAASAQASIGTSHDYELVKKFLADLASRYPGNAEVFQLGKNSQGLSVYGLKVGSGPVKNLIVGTHHGNESAATDLALAAAADLAGQPVAGRTIYVIPVLNISGFNANRRREQIANDPQITQDPNRDYPGPCGSAGPFVLKSTQALANFIEREGIVSSATIHTPGPIVLYPWGHDTKDSHTNYEREFIALAEMCTQDSGYAIGNSGVNYKPANGTFEDYAFWKHGIWSLLFEVSESNHPTDSELEVIIQGNVPGLRRFMQNAPVERAPDHEFKGTCTQKLTPILQREE